MHPGFFHCRLFPELRSISRLPNRELQACGRLMKVVGRKELERFARKHADVRGQIDSWLCEIEEAHWQTTSDIKRRYAHASFLADNRVVFNLRGNNYRLDTKVSFKNQIVVVVRIGTHEEYSGWKF